MLACQQRGIAPADAAVAIKESPEGDQAARAAGTHDIVTPSEYTVGATFPAADLVLPSLGDPPGPHITLARLTTVEPAVGLHH